ncbi:hypothetical protein SLEP1_g12359 [Rubroshorea leprosula]|uniref:Reverse transcriptase/retrotransposon-derived protein RNase H-like domain-containing protein n=1 Tax=Rubroshorea leprosula TaxID=152421 RepID=A0AAV5IKS7_9ROSI|nr:hypothetical protein SLEP1_g12359 [Rubroshorea leprosula]
MARTFTGSRPPRNEINEQEDTQLSELGLIDFRPMSRNLFVGGAEQDQLSGTDDDERTPTRYATQLEQFQIPTGTRQRHPRLYNSQHEQPERSTKLARTTELEERTRVLKMAMAWSVPRRLLENPPKTWNEVNDRSASFILSEDFQSSKRRVDDKQSKSQEQPPRREEKKKQKHWVRRPPPPLHDSPRADKSKHCDYHRTYGHNTKDRQHLKDELGFLARNGKLEGYVQKPYTQQPTQTHFVHGYDRPQGQRRGQGQRTAAYSQKDREGVSYDGIPQPPDTINMISRGIHSGGQSARGRKAYARQVMIVNKNRPLKRPFEEAEWVNAPITFNPADYKRVDEGPDVMMPHADPFVAMVHIEPRFRMASVSFLVVKMESAFNAILGRATLCELKAIISQPHLCMKFPTLQGVGVLKGNQKMTRACYQDTFKEVKLAAAPASSEIHRLTQLSQQTMSILDIEHRPEGVEQKAKPVEPVETVPLNPDVPERTVKIGTKLIEKERAELLEFLRANQDVFAWTTDEMPGILAELTVHKLSTDPTKRLVVQKRRLFGLEKQAAIDEEIQKLLQASFIRRVEYSKWACPKDPHPLPNVEKLVEQVARHKRMSFLNAGSRYHQVQLLLDNQEKTAFYAGDAIYCYVMMPFGLKNAGTTYQKLVQIIFKLQIELALNPNETESPEMHVRCKIRKFLGYVVSKKGIEVNPEKVQAVQQMEPPRTVKDVQRLTGHVAALHSQQAFDKLKQYLASAPLLSKPMEGESLYLYLGVTEEAVSSVLLREENKNQKPICYVSKVLQGAEQNYPLAEKAAFALKPKLSGRLIEWSVELSEYDLKFQPHTTIKGQVVADFLVECISATVEKKAPEHPVWVLYVDEAANVEGSGARAVLVGPDGFKSEHTLRFKFQTTNNVAEYEALIYRLKLASELKV